MVIFRKYQNNIKLISKTHLVDTCFNLSFFIRVAIRHKRKIEQCNLITNRESGKRCNTFHLERCLKIKFSTLLVSYQGIDEVNCKWSRRQTYWWDNRTFGYLAEGKLSPHIWNKNTKSWWAQQDEMSDHAAKKTSNSRRLTFTDLLAAANILDRFLTLVLWKVTKLPTFLDQSVSQTKPGF